MLSKKIEGFTLIELIIVLAVIALLAAVIFVAVNPQKRFGEAQNSLREQNSKELEKSIASIIADNGYNTPAELSSLTLNNPYMLVTAGGSTVGQTICDTLNNQLIDRIDLASLMEPYVGTLPTDLLATSSDDTGYYVTRVSDSSFYVDHCYEYTATVAEEAPAWACGDLLTDDRDSKTYATVEIGSQCWMKQNINVGTRINGASNQTNNGVIQKYCYDDLDANCDTNNNPNYPDGGLYQWGEAMAYAASCNGTGEPPNDACASPVQGICPSGWHMPSHYEFSTLEQAVCDSASCATDFPYDTTTTGYRGTDEGTQLKANGSSGFEVNMAGNRVITTGAFNGRGTSAYLRSSLESGSNAWYRNFASSRADDLRNVYSKQAGYSVRCIQD